MRPRIDREKAFKYMLDNPTKSTRTLSKHLGISFGSAYNIQKELAHTIRKDKDEIASLKRKLNDWHILADATTQCAEEWKRKFYGLREELEEEFRKKEVIWNNKIRELMDKEPHVMKVDDEPRLTSNKGEAIAALILGAVTATCVTAYLFISNGAI
jgi:hypothetical protein